MSKRKLRRQLVIEAGSPAIIKAAKEENGIPTFTMEAYTGGLMNVTGWYLPVVIDLAGMALGRRNQPILKDHDASQIVGHATEIIKSENNVIVEGICSGAGSANMEVVASSKNGFPWQASVGLEVNRVSEIAEGKSVTVNGMNFDGPLYVARKSKLNEVSFVALGADENTSAKVAASAAEDLFIDMEEIEMTDEERKAVEAQKANDAKVKEKLEAEKADAEKQAAENAAKIEASKLQAAGTQAAVEAVRNEQMRIDKVKAACKGYPEVEEKAIKDGLSVVEAKAAILDVIEARQASSIGASYVNTGEGAQEVNSDVLTAAACISTGAIKAGKLEDSFNEKTLDAAHKLGRLGLKGLIEACVRSEGGHISAAMSSENDLIQAGFSTMSLPNMLSNVANKALVDGFMSLPSTASIVAEQLTANDFKQHTGVKLGGMGLMERVQNGGQIKSGTQSEETFTYAINTVGKLIGLTREMLKNDDLGGFTRTAMNLGISAKQTLERDFWQLVLANTSSFFSAANSNLTDEVLDVDSIGTADQLLIEQTGIDGQPINIMGKWLVVPPALKKTALEIAQSAFVIGGSTRSAASNVYAGSYEPVVTPYLANSTVNANASDTGWYLFSDTLKPFGIAYLGRMWVGYFDYAVCQVEHRGGVFSSGDGS
jgi:hypothetical protein